MKDSGALAIWRLVDAGDYPSEVPVALSRKSFRLRRQFMSTVAEFPKGSRHVIPHARELLW
jgi:hypothetical protein